MYWLIILPAIVYLLISLITLFLSPFYFIKGWFKKFYHDMLGWHYPIKTEDGDIFYDEYGFGICEHCRKEIHKNYLTGNWED